MINRSRVGETVCTGYDRSWLALDRLGTVPEDEISAAVLALFGRGLWKTSSEPLRLGGGVSDGLAQICSP